MIVLKACFTISRTESPWLVDIDPIFSLKQSIVAHGTRHIHHATNVRCCPFASSRRLHRNQHRNATIPQRSPCKDAGTHRRRRRRKLRGLGLRLHPECWKWMVGRLLSCWGPAYFQGVMLVTGSVWFWKNGWYCNVDCYISGPHIPVRKNPCVSRHVMSTLDRRYNDDARRNLFGSEVLDDYLEGHLSLGWMSRGWKAYIYTYVDVRRITQTNAKHKHKL